MHLSVTVVGFGDLNEILQGAAYGAVAGAATGAVLGGVKYAYEGHLYVKADQPRAANFGGTASSAASSSARSAGFSDVAKAIGKGVNFGISQAATGTLFNINMFEAMYQGGFTTAAADAYLYNQYMQRELEVKYSVRY